MSAARSLRGDRSACLLLLLAVLAWLSAVQLQRADASRVRSERSTVPKGWLALRAAPPSLPVRFTVGLRSASVDELAATFWAVSEPTSVHYLQLLSRDEIEQRFGASHDDRQLVLRWLASYGVEPSEVRHVASAIEVHTVVAVAERLFATQMRLFQHSLSGKQVVRAWGRVQLPEAVHEVVELLTGLSSFPIPRESPIKRPKQQSSAPEPEAVVPQTVRALYQIRAQSAGSGRTTQGMIEFQEQYFDNNDTALLAWAVGYTAANQSIPPIADEHVVGRNDANPQRAGIESSLDVQMLSSTNVEAQTWFWIEAGQAWMYEYALHVLNASSSPQVVSISYGWWEGMQCWADTLECELLNIDSDRYAAATNALFMKIGLLGTSIVVSSGDSGANSRTDEMCAAANLRPEFPASSPYVTTVGATMLVNATYGFTDVPACAAGQFSCVSAGREVAVSRSLAGFTSGGGFSNISGATRPAYQAAAVQAYLDSGVQLPPASFYNVHGRAEPDVAAVGSKGLIAVSGELRTIGGTSMSAPIFAGVVSLLNEIAVAKTGKSLGFLNPLLYRMAADAPDTFHDITVGDNICPEQYCGVDCRGFQATAGWDPVTGLGTPNAARMEAYISQLLDDVLARRAASSAVKEATAAATPATNVQRSRLSTASLQPNQTWTAIRPDKLAALSDSVVLALGSSVLEVSLHRHQVLGNYSVDSSLRLTSLAASSTAAYVLLSDPLNGGVTLDAVDVASGSVVSSASIQYPTVLLDVTADGQTALTSAQFSSVVLFNTSTGARIAIMGNQSWATVIGGALNLQSAQLWVIWLDEDGSSVGLDVVYAANQTTRASFTPPSPLTTIQAVAVDKAGQYAYVQYQTSGAHGGSSFTISQLNAASLETERTWDVPSSLPPTVPIKAGSRVGELYYASNNRLVLVTASGFSTVLLGDTPFLSSPTDVAVATDGSVLVALNQPWQIVALNVSGHITATYPIVDELELCTDVPDLRVAVDWQDSVYVPLCNSTVLVFSRGGDEVARVETGNSTRLRDIAAGPHDSLFFTDDAQPLLVRQIGRNGSLLRSFTAPRSGSRLYSVHFDSVDGVLYVTDAGHGLLLSWPLNSTGQPTVLDVSLAIGQPVSVYSVAVDRAHSQLIVATVSTQLSKSFVLWFDLAGRLLDRNFTFFAPSVTGVAVSPDGSRVYATDYVFDSVYVFDQHGHDSATRQARADSAALPVATD